MFVRHRERHRTGRIGWQFRSWSSHASLGHRQGPATDPRGLLEQQSEELNLSPEFKTLLERFVPTTARRALTERLTA